MTRLTPCVVLLLVAGAARADSFDNYTNLHLRKLITSPNVEKSKRIAPEDLVIHSDVLPGVQSAFLVVRTNEGRLSKLLVKAAGQKISREESVPILLVERFVTFREAEDRTVWSEARNLRLFHDFRLSLDIGHMVPAKVTADLRFVVEDGKAYVEPVGKAELFLVTKHLPEALPPKGGKIVLGEKFEPRLFEGVYKLHDDGRRSGDLHLKVDMKGRLTGHYFSDKDGAKYDVEGQVGPTPTNGAQFRIVYPRTTQFFTGWMFTGDARVITGFSRIEERETGFYAQRLPD